MTSLGRAVLLVMIPANVLLLLWMWIGRALFGAAGWWMIIGLAVLPFVIVGMVLTTVIAYRGAGTPRALTRSQALLQLTSWAGMLAFGFFLVDFSDAPESDASVFTQLAGRTDSTLSLSWNLSGISVGVALVAWVLLLVLLIVQKRKHAGVAQYA